jgi:hypothetical protein
MDTIRDMVIRKLNSSTHQSADNHDVAAIVTDLTDVAEGIDTDMSVRDIITDIMRADGGAAFWDIAAEHDCEPWG